MAKRKPLNPVKLKAYLENTAKEEYGFDDESKDDFVTVVLEYAANRKLVSYNEVLIYIDGLLTPLEIETGALGE